MNEETSTISLLDGNVEFKREDHITFFNSNVKTCDENGIEYNTTDPIWVPFGEDNEEITRELNNEVEAKKNVLGRTKINHTKGPQTTEIDPITIRGNDALSKILYMMYKYDLVGDKANLQCMEVTYADKQSTGTYGAFRETAVVDLKSWGGDTTGLNAPVTLNWKGDKEHGTFSTATKKFTATTVVE